MSYAFDQNSDYCAEPIRKVLSTKMSKVADIGNDYYRVYSDDQTHYWVTCKGDIFGEGSILATFVGGTKNAMQYEALCGAKCTTNLPCSDHPSGKRISGREIKPWTQGTSFAA